MGQLSSGVARSGLVGSEKACIINGDKPWFRLISLISSLYANCVNVQNMVMGVGLTSLFRGGVSRVQKTVPEILFKESRI